MVRVFKFHFLYCKLRNDTSIMCVKYFKHIQPTSGIFPTYKAHWIYEERMKLMQQPSLAKLYPARYTNNTHVNFRGSLTVCPRHVPRVPTYWLIHHCSWSAERV